VAAAEAVAQLITIFQAQVALVVEVLAEQAVQARAFLMDNLELPIVVVAVVAHYQMETLASLVAQVVQESL
jgi:dihydroorotase